MDPKGSWGIAIGAVVVLLAVGGVFYSMKKGGGLVLRPTPSPAVVQQLEAEKQPKIKLVFSKDGHYVTVNISNLFADTLEYNLIYDAVVKKSPLQTGVNAAASVAGKSTYSQEQLLGSESSGKFTYHEDITNAIMELTLRDDQGRSIFTATYPFSVSAGSSAELNSE
ncbi:MAG: hypothetical protein Q7S31_00355 [bacterium]|nr:hypothetical protein [bacterium]